MNILILEDDFLYRETLVDEFTDRDWEVVQSANLAEASFYIEQHSFSHALIDARLGGENGLDALQLIQSKQPDCRCVVLTGFGTIPLATQAMRLGAFEVLTKPVGIEPIVQALTQVPSEPPSVSWGNETLFEHQRAYIDFTLIKTGNNISETARVLGLHRQSLQRILRKRIT